MTFEVIAYPAPHRYKVWFKGPTKEASIVDVEDSAAVVTCRPNERHRYLTSCSLKVFNRTSHSGGSYKIQVINELGDENFTVDVISGVTLTPCGRDGVSDVTAGQKTQFVCMNGGQIEWRLNVDNVATQVLLASCDGNACNPSDAFEKTFTASVQDSHPTLTINAVNSTLIYNKVQIVNGTLLCTPKTKESPVVCGLNYVSPPENVSCQEVNKSLSCVVGAVYSSRNIYMCHLLRFKNGTEKEILESVTMVTSPTTDKITKSEVKVSGSCQFNTPLPSEAGGYRFYVSVSPGGRHFLLKLESIDKGITGDFNKISFLINNREKNETVMEGDYVNLRCEADGLPPSEMSISNGDNNTVITSNSSVVNYTFIARCEDTTMYMCFLGNKSFSPSSATTSLNVSLDSTGSYKIQVINEVGDENFTVDVTSMHIPDEPLTKSVTGGVIGAFLLIILTVLVLFVVNRRRKSGKDCKLENTSDTIYQNPWDTVPLTVRGLGPGWRTAPCSPDGAVDTGRWRNQDGLLYVSPSFNDREQYISQPHEPTKYSTVKVIQPQVHPS
ncbi:hypothetical protein C0Q70_12313 [Pomacea canaliculata]|uniref:Ig-like domain-containing protein n=1 Tax=Pomacea canaliculata TaxID=400727 RepID=A0A2T7P176_POMCA|nr:hypothetical protein C0Q70_12313 [Pomacea canaliculata]